MKIVRGRRVNIVAFIKVLNDYQSYRTGVYRLQYTPLSSSHQHYCTVYALGLASCTGNTVTSHVPASLSLNRIRGITSFRAESVQPLALPLRTRHTSAKPFHTIES